MDGLIPAGSYPATVTGSTLGRAGNGAEQIVIGLDVHVIDRESGQMYPAQMSWYGSFTDKALPITDRALNALGFDMGTRDLSELSPEDPATSPIVNAQCEVVIEIEHSEEYGSRNRVKWINRTGGGLAVKERMDATQARAFGSTLRQRLLAARGPGARPAAAPQRPAAAPSGRPAVPPARPPQGPPAAPRQPVQQRTESGPRPTDPPAGTGWTDDIPF